MGIKRDLIQSPAKNCQNNCSYHTKCYHPQVGGQLCVREFRPFSELISPPWLWKSSEDIYFCQSLHQISELSLKIMHLLSFLWSFDENLKIERALHFLIQLWITCKKALHLNFIIFKNFQSRNLHSFYQKYNCSTPNVFTSQGVGISVKGTAQVLLDRVV